MLTNEVLSNAYGSIFQTDRALAVSFIRKLKGNFSNDDGNG